MLAVPICNVDNSANVPKLLLKILMVALWRRQ